MIAFLVFLVFALFLINLASSIWMIISAILDTAIENAEIENANPIVAEIYSCEQETASKLKLSRCEGKYVEVMIAKEISLAAEEERSLAAEKSLAATEHCCCEEGFTPSSILCEDKELCYHCDKIERI